MKVRTYWLIISLMAVFLATIICMWTVYDFHYQQNRCLNLQADNGGYSFNTDVQVNAEYTKNCYDLLNYKLELFQRIILTLVLFCVLVFLAGLLIYMVLDMGGYYE